MSANPATTQHDVTPVALQGYPTELLGGSPAVVAGDLVFVSGLWASDFVHGIAPDATPPADRPYDQPTVKLQTRHVFRQLVEILEASGSGLDELLRLDQFCIGRETANGYIEARNEFLTTDRPASVLVGVEQHMVPGAVIQLDAIAVRRHGAVRREARNSESLKYNVSGGYSQAVTAGDWVFIAGSVASDLVGDGAYPSGAGTGLAPEARVNENYWYGSPIKAQTKYVMHEKLEPMLEAGGSSLRDVVQAQVYLTDIQSDWAGFCEAWSEIYPQGGPALSLFPASTFGAIGARIEICLIGVKRGGAITVESTPEMAAIGPAPAATQAGGLVHLSTQIADSGIKDRGLPYHHSDSAHQMAAILESIERIASAHGGSLASIARARLMLTDPSDLFGALGEWRHALGGHRPALTPFCIRGPLPAPYATVALDVVLSVP